MKLLKIFLLFVFLLSSCVPVATAIPTLTPKPTQTATIMPTNTPVPTNTLTPTITPTPLPITFIYQDDVPADTRALQEQAANKAYIYYSQYAELGEITIYTFSDIEKYIDQVLPALQADIPNYTKSKFRNEWPTQGGTVGKDTILINSGYLAWKDNSNLCLKAKTIAHEMFHYLQSELIHHGLFRPALDYGPEWIKEGSAEVFGYKIADELNGCSASVEISSWLNNSKVANYQLAEIEGGDFSSKMQFWSLAPYAVDYLIKLAPNGEKSVITYYAGISNGISWKESFESSFGISIEDFYANFESSRPKEGIDTSVCTTQSDARVKCLGIKPNKDFIFSIPSIVTTQADQWKVESACNITGWGLEGSGGHLILQISVTGDTHGSCQVKVTFSTDQQVTVDFVVP